MKFTLKNAKQFGWEGIKGFEYNNRDDFANASIAFAEVDGRHGKIKNIKSDRIYIIADGEGEFIPEAAENPFHKEWDESGSVYPARIVKAVAGCEDAMGVSP